MVFGLSLAENRPELLLADMDRRVSSSSYHLPDIHSLSLVVTDAITEITPRHSNSKEQSASGILFVPKIVLC